MATYTLKFEIAPDTVNNADTSTCTFFIDGASLGTVTSGAANGAGAGVTNWQTRTIDVTTHVKTDQPMPEHTVEWRYSSGGDGGHIRNMRIESSDGAVCRDQFGTYLGTSAGGVAVDGSGAPTQIDHALNDGAFKQSGTLNCLHRIDCTNLLSAGDKPAFSLVAEFRGDSSTTNGTTNARAYWDGGATLGTRSVLQCWTWGQWNHELHWGPRAWNLSSLITPAAGAWWGRLELDYASGEDGTSVRRVRVYDWAGAAWVQNDVLAYGAIENPLARIGTMSTTCTRAEANVPCASTSEPTHWVVNSTRFPLFFADGYPHRWWAHVDIAPDQANDSATNDSEWKLAGLVLGRRRSNPANSTTVRNWRTIVFEITGLLDETPLAGTENPFEGSYTAGGDAVTVRNVFARSAGGDEQFTQYDPALWLDQITATLSTDASMKDCVDTASAFTSTGSAWARYYLGGVCAGGADLDAFKLVFDLSPDYVTTGSSNDQTRIQLRFNGSTLAEATAGPAGATNSWDWKEIRRNIGHLWIGDGTDHLEWRFFSIPHDAPYSDAGHVRRVRVEDDLGNIVETDQYAVDIWWDRTGSDADTAASGTDDAETFYRNTQRDVCGPGELDVVTESTTDWNDHYFPGVRCGGWLVGSIQF